MWLLSPGRPGSGEGKLGADILTVADDPAAKAADRTALRGLSCSTGSIAMLPEHQ